jgi:hypothetical protein
MSGWNFFSLLRTPPPFKASICSPIHIVDLFRVAVVWLEVWAPLRHTKATGLGENLDVSENCICCSKTLAWALSRFVTKIGNTDFLEKKCCSFLVALSPDRDPHCSSAIPRCPKNHQFLNDRKLIWRTSWYGNSHNCCGSDCRHAYWHYPYWISIVHTMTIHSEINVDLSKII